MNKETEQIINFLDKNNEYTSRIMTLQGNQRNLKDFTNQMLYLVMDVINQEKQFFGMNRNEIDINTIAEEYF